jgi:two-component system, NtrC family, sensor kinase
LDTKKNRWQLPEAISLGPFSGLRARVILLIALLTALLVVLFGAVVVRLLEHHLVKQKRDQGRTALLAMQAGFDLQEFLDHGKRKTGVEMPRFIQIMAQNLELSSLVIVDRDQNVVGHSRADMIGLVLAEEDLERAVTERKLIHRLIGRDTRTPEVIISGPLYRDGKVFGAARFSLPLENLYVALSDTRRVLFLYALMDALALILVGSVLLWWVLVKPVEQMVKATEAMAAGNYRLPPPASGNNEIARLGRALSKLGATLEDREKVNRRQMTRLEKINEELKQAHDQLVHSDRLAYVGRVAAGVAHEIGNPLGAIYGYLEIMRDADLNEEEHAVVERAERDVRRIDTIVRELLDFSRVKPAEARPIDLLGPAEEAAGLLKTQRGLDHIEVTVKTGQDVPKATLDPRQLVQVVLNILINAADAMTGVGDIEISAEAGRLDRAALMEAQLPGAPPEREVTFTNIEQRGIVFSDPISSGEDRLAAILHITDSGPGMAPEVLAQMFDPFFTTKQAGKGTGLGMAISHRIVAGAGGVIRVESHSGHGTRVSLLFPAAEG